MTKKTTDVPVTRSAGPAPAAGPWPGFGNLREEMERLFDSFEPRHWFERAPAAFASLGGEAMRNPAVDFSENHDGYTVTADLPGMEPDEITVKISNGTLTISGEKSSEETKEEDTYHLRERRWGSFMRSIRLPEDVDRDKIESEFTNGVLTVKMPKSEAALAAERTIAIKAA